MTRRAPLLHFLLLVGVVAVFSGVNLWTVLRDQRPMISPDGFLLPALSLHLADSAEKFWDVIAISGPKAPLAALLSLGLMPLVGGEVPLAMRLVSLLAHLGAMALAFHLARRLGGRRAGGLWAAAIVGACPGIFAWARLPFRELPLAVAVLLTLRLMLTADLRRMGPALGLGAMLGLGLLTKIGFIVFMVFPGLWLLSVRLRRAARGGAVELGATVRGFALLLAAMVLISLPWAAPNIAAIAENAVGSATYSDISIYEKVSDYLAHPFTLVLVLATLPAALWLRRQPGVSRDALVLLGGTAVTSLGLFFLVFDGWPRYIAPGLAVCAVLVGSALGRLQGRLPRAGRVALVLILAAAISASYLRRNSSIPPDYDRDSHHGMQTPDPRPHDAAGRALAAIEVRDGAFLLVFDCPDAFSHTEGLEVVLPLWAARGVAPRQMTLAQAKARLARGRPVFVLLVRRHFAEPLDRRLLPLWDEIRRLTAHKGEMAQAKARLRRLTWLIARPNQRFVDEWMNPGEISFVVQAVYPDGAALPPPDRPDPVAPGVDPDLPPPGVDPDLPPAGVDPDLPPPGVDPDLPPPGALTPHRPQAKETAP